MKIEDFEFEELNTQVALAELLEKIARQIREGKELELPMPTVKDGFIRVPLGEPIETGIEVNLRKYFTHVTIEMSWEKPQKGANP